MSEFQDEDLLRLFLGLNAKYRMPPLCWEFLTIRDLISCASVSKEIRQKLMSDGVEYTRCRDGKDYLVPFPGFPGLLSTKQDLLIGAGLFPHQLASLSAMYRMENATTAFGSLRGGILGDAPGLGKTITMLALIASTSGRRPVSPSEFWDASSVEEGWKHLRINPMGTEEILKALKPIRNWMQGGSQRFQKKFQDLAKYVSPPFDDGRFPTIRDFELHVYRTLNRFVPRAELELFRSNIVNIKAGLDKRNRKLLKGMKGRRLILERKLIASSATLLIVPDALLEHWYQQIHEHLNLSIFSDDNESGLKNIVYVDGIGDFVDARLPLRRASTNQEVPFEWDLSQYFIVITTFSRCEAESKKHVQWDQQSRKRRLESENSNQHSSPFHKIRWLRVVVDEGHELGVETHEATAGATHFIHEIAAERRWVLSGTPTTGDEDDFMFSSLALDQLQRLLVFLRHPLYGNLSSETPIRENSNENSRNKEKAKKQWATQVKRPFLSKRQEGRTELKRVLTECLVMHKKEDLKLPKPIFHQAEVYTPIPTYIQNSMLEDLDAAPRILDSYLHTDEYQKLVDEAQADYIRHTLRKAKDDLRKRGGAIKTGSAGVVADYERMDCCSDDRRPIKAVVYSSKRFDLISVTEFLLKRLPKENVAELHDPKAVNSMGFEMSRFRNDFKEIRICPICQRENEVTSIEGSARHHRCLQPLLEVVEVSTFGRPRRFLIEAERIRKPVDTMNGGNVYRERMDGEPFTNYGLNQRFWKAGDLLEVDIRSDYPVLPQRWSEEKWEDYNVQKCIELAEKDWFRGRDWYFGPLPQMNQNQSIMIVRLEKWQQCWSFHNPKWYTGPKIADAPIQKIEEDVFLLSLDAGLSHGLDLSYLTHMFLLEPIKDAALLEQVTSRAHRLGAKGPVRVETVNVFYSLSHETQKKMEERALLNKDHEALSVRDALAEEKRRALTRECCQFCYREFFSKAQAEHHEQTNCPRNPSITSAVDPFHLSSVYREMKPPPAVLARPPTDRTVNTEGVVG